MKRSLPNNPVIRDDHHLRFPSNRAAQFDVGSALTDHGESETLEYVHDIPTGHLRCARHGMLYADGRDHFSASRPEVCFGFLVSVFEVEADRFLDVLASLLERITL